MRIIVTIFRRTIIYFMIIYRYLSRQLFWSTLAVSTILTFVLVSSRFLKYLSDAAVGKLEGFVVFVIMAYRLPDFLQLILPLGLFLGILLAYGRMYLENEMVVLQACGVSQRQLLYWSLIPAFCMSLLIGFFSFYAAPWGAQKASDVMFEQEKRSGLDVLSPRRFHASSDGRTVTYVENLDSQAGVMENLFIVDYDRDSGQGEYRKVVIMRAAEGRYRIDNNGDRYLVMSDGVRFEVDPGKSHFEHFNYGVYRIKLEQKVLSEKDAEFEELSTQALWEDGSLRANVELQWRLSLMLMVPIVVVMAVPLARVNPRQGRYYKMLPAILMYLAYLSSLMAAKGAVEKGQIASQFGILWVHLIFIGLGVMLNYWPQFLLNRSKRRMQRTSVAVS